MANKKDPRTQVAGNQTGSSGFFSKRAHVLSKRLEFERHMSVFVFKLLLVAFFALVAVGVWIGDGSADISQEAEALLWVGVALAAVEILVKLGFWTGILRISHHPLLFKLSIYLSLAFTYIVYPLMVSFVGRLMRFSPYSNSGIKSASTSLSWLYVIIIIALAGYLHFSEFKTFSVFPSKSGWPLVLDHKMYAILYFGWMLQFFQSQFTYTTYALQVHIIFSTLTVTLLWLNLGLVLFKKLPSLFWDTNLSVMYLSLSAVTISFKIMIELMPLMLAKQMKQNVLIKSVVSTLLLSPLMCKLAYSISYEKIMVDPFKKESSSKTRTVGVWYLLDCMFFSELDPHAAGVKSQTEVFFEGVLHGCVQNMQSAISTIEGFLSQSQPQAAQQTKDQLITRVLPALKEVCPRAWLLLATRGSPSLAEVFSCLQHVKKETGLSDISAQLEYYNFRKLYETKLDVLYKGTATEGEQSSGRNSHRVESTATSKLSWYFREQEDYMALRSRIKSQIHERVELYRYLASHPVSNSSKIHTTNSNCTNIQKTIQSLKQNYLVSPETHLAKAYSALVYYFGVVRNSKKTADDIVKLYKRKLESVLNAKIKLESLFQANKLSMASPTGDLSVLTEYGTVSLQVNLEHRNHYPITQMSTNYPSLLGNRPETVQPPDLSDLIPSSFAVAHKSTTAGMMFCPGTDTDTAKQETDPTKRPLLIETLSTSHSKGTGGTLIKTFDQRTVLGEVTVQMLPCLDLGITALCRVSFTKRAQEGLLLCNEDLKLLQAEPLVLELLQHMSGADLPINLNLVKFSSELALGAKIMKILSRDNIRKLLTEDPYRRSAQKDKVLRDLNKKVHKSITRGECTPTKSKEISPFLFVKELLQTFWVKNLEQSICYSCHGDKMATGTRVRVPAHIVDCEMLGIPVTKIFFNLGQASWESKAPSTWGSMGSPIFQNKAKGEVEQTESPARSTNFASQTGESGVAEMVSISHEEKVPHLPQASNQQSKFTSSIKITKPTNTFSRRQNSDELSNGLSSGIGQPNTEYTMDEGAVKNSIHELVKPVFAVLEQFSNLSDAKTEDLFSYDLAPFTTGETELDFRILISELLRLKTEYQTLATTDAQAILAVLDASTVKRSETKLKTKMARSPSMEAKLHMKIPMSNPDEINPQRMEQLSLQVINKMKAESSKHQDQQLERKIMLSPKVDALKLKLFLIKTRLAQKPLVEKLQVETAASTMGSPELRVQRSPFSEATTSGTRFIPMPTMDSNFPHMKPLFGKSKKAHKVVSIAPDSLRDLPIQKPGIRELFKRFQSFTSSPVLLALQPVKMLLELLQRRNLSDLPVLNKQKTVGNKRDVATESVVGSVGSSVAQPIYVYFAALDQQIKGLLHFRKYAMVSLANGFAIAISLAILFVMAVLSNNYISVNFAHYKTVTSLVSLNNAYSQTLWSSMTNTSLIYYWSILSYLLSFSSAIDPRVLAPFTLLVRAQYSLSQTTLGVRDVRPFLNQRLMSTIDRLTQSLEQYEFNQQEINDNSARERPNPELEKLSSTAPADFRLQIEPYLVYKPISIQSFVKATIVQAQDQWRTTELMAQYFDNKTLPFSVPVPFIIQKYVPALVAQVGMIQNSFRGVMTNMEKQIIFLRDEILETLPKHYSQQYNIGVVMFCVSLVVFLLSVWFVLRTTKAKLFQGIQLFGLLKFEDAQISLSMYEETLDEFKRSSEDEYSQVLRFILSTTRNNNSNSLQIMESKRELLSSQNQKQKKRGAATMMQTRLALRKNIHIKEDFKFDSVKSFLGTSIVILILLVCIFWGSVTLHSYLLAALTVQRGYLDNYLKVVDVSRVYLAFNLYSTYGYFIKMDGQDADKFLSSQPIKDFQTYWISRRADFETEALSRSSDRESLADLKEIIFGDICSQFQKRGVTTVLLPNGTRSSPLLKVCKEYLPSQRGLLAIWDQLPTFINNSVTKMKVQVASFLNSTKKSFSINLIQDNLVSAEGIRLTYLHDFGVELIIDKYSQIISKSVTESSDFVKSASLKLQWGAVGLMIGLYLLSCLRYFMVLRRDSEASTEAYCNILPDIIFNNPYLYQVYKEQFMQVL